MRNYASTSPNPQIRNYDWHNIISHPHNKKSPIGQTRKLRSQEIHCFVMFLQWIMGVGTWIQLVWHQSWAIPTTCQVCMPTLRLALQIHLPLNIESAANITSAWSHRAIILSVSILMNAVVSLTLNSSFFLLRPMSLKSTAKHECPSWLPEWWADHLCAHESEDSEDPLVHDKLLASMQVLQSPLRTSVRSPKVYIPEEPMGIGGVACSYFAVFCLLWNMQSSSAGSAPASCRVIILILFGHYALWWQLRTTRKE